MTPEITARTRESYQHAFDDALHAMSAERSRYFRHPARAADALSLLPRDPEVVDGPESGWLLQCGDAGVWQVNARRALSLSDDGLLHYALAKLASDAWATREESVAPTCEAVRAISLLPLPVRNTHLGLTRD